MKQIKYLPYLLLVIVIIILIVRELSHSKYTHKEALKLQSEKNKTAWATKQINESKQNELKYLQERDVAHDLAGLYKMDIERQLIDLKALKSKIKQYEISDRSILYNTDRVMDSLYKSRYPIQDSLYRIRTAPGLPRP